MVLSDGGGTALGVHLAQATPAEVKLLEPTLLSGRIGGRRAKPRKPKRLTQIEATTATRRELCWSSETSSRSSRPAVITKSPRIKTGGNCGVGLRRWIIERMNSWLQSFRRLVVRYERSATIFTALVHLACALTTLKRILG